MNIKSHSLRAGWMLATNTIAVFSAMLAPALAASYPDVGGISEPTANYPGGFSSYNPPTDSGLSIDANAPQIAEWTRNNAPGDTMALTGEKLSVFSGADEGRDTRFLVCALGNTVYDMLIQRLDGQQCALTFPSGLTPNEVYLMWPHNNNGYGEPVRINNAELWWSNDRVTPGGTFRVYGQNLTLGASSSYLYVKELDQWLVASDANPYMAEYTFPASATTRSYTIYAHNGHGKKYGWSKALQIQVVNDTGFSPDKNTWHDVTKLGLVADGTTDNRDALAALWSSVQNESWPTIYFPAGTYLIGGTTEVSLSGGSANGVRIIGDGPGQSVLVCKTATGNTQSIRLYKNNSVFKDIEIRKAAIGLGGNFSRGMYLYHCDNLLFDNVLFNSYYASATETWRPILEADQVHHVSFNNCGFYLQNNMYFNAQDVTFDTCDFRGVHDNGSYGIGAVSELAVINSTGRPYDNSDKTDGAGWGKGRWFVSGVSQGSSHWYIGNNQSTNAEPRLYAGNDWNAGEQFMKEGGFAIYRGTVSSASANTATFSDLSGRGIDAWHGMTATIVSGKGFGQSRLVSSMSGNTITTFENWRVVPDSTSAIVLGRFATKWVFYQNHLHSDLSDYVGGYDCASAGIQFSSGGGANSVIIDDNTFDGVDRGIALDISGGTAFSSSISTVSPWYFGLIKNNKFLGVTDDFLDMTHNYPSTGNEFAEDALMLGVVYRKNVSTNAVHSVYLTGTSNEDNDSVYLTVFDQNSGTGFAALDIASNGRYNDVWVGNTYNGSGNGIKLFSYPVVLRNNTLTGFSSKYTGSLPGAILQVPVRCVDMDPSQTSKTVSIWDSGTASLAWTASENSSWFDISPATGTVPNENSSGSLTLNLLSTPADGSTATITLTGAGQTRKITVVFNAASGSVQPVSMYPVSVSPGQTVRVVILDENDVQLSSEDITSPQTINIADLPTEWDKIKIMVYDEQSQTWNTIHQEWRGNK